MDLNFFEARKKIKSGGLFPAYLFYGEEAFLREELLRILEEAFLGEDSQFGREKVDGSAMTLGGVIERFSGGNLFASRLLLVVDSPPYLAPPRPGKADSEAEEEGGEGAAAKKAKAREDDEGFKALERFMERESAKEPQNIVVFVAPAADRRKKIYKLLSARGLAADCSPLKREDLARWIKERAAGAGKTIERTAIEQLLLTGESDLWHLANELEKYTAYLGDDRDVITGDVVELLYSGGAGGNVFKLADALSEGNLIRALHLLELLLVRREKPLQIFFMLVRHFRLMLAAWDFRREKESSDAFARAMKIQPFAARKLYKQAAAYDLATLEEIIIALQRIDLSIKTGALNPEGALEITLGQIHHLYTASRKRKSRRKVGDGS